MDKKIKPGSKKVDIVWVEDEKWFIRDWKKQYPDLIIYEYYEPESALDDDIDQYPLDTKIFLDSTYYIGPYSNKVYVGEGTDLAKKLHARGFTNLFMIMGDEPSGDLAFGYLKLIHKQDDKKIKEAINS